MDQNQKNGLFSILKKHYGDSRDGKDVVLYARETC
jgi:hypothetical protein